MLPDPRPSGLHDLEAIKARLADTAESWVPQLFPNGRRVGNQWRLANIRGDAPRKNGSCVIDLAGPYAGGWFDRLAKSTGHWVRFNGAGTRDIAWPEVDGPVHAVVGDGAGGWSPMGSPSNLP